MEWRWRTHSSSKANRVHTMSPWSRWGRQQGILWRKRNNARCFPDWKQKSSNQSSNSTNSGTPPSQQVAKKDSDFSKVAHYQAKRALAYKNIEKLLPFYKATIVKYEIWSMRTVSYIERTLVSSYDEDNQVITDIVSNKETANKLLLHYKDHSSEKLDLKYQADFAKLAEYSLEILDFSIRQTNSCMTKPPSSSKSYQTYKRLPIIQKPSERRSVFPNVKNWALSRRPVRQNKNNIWKTVWKNSCQLMLDLPVTIQSSRAIL